MKVCLSEIAEFITDGTHGSPERTEEGVPVLSAQNVTGGILTYSTSRYTSEKEYQTFKKRLDIAIGDVLLTIVGSIGRAAVVSENRPAVFQRSVAVIRPKRQTADSSYLLHLFHSSYFQSELYRNSNQSSQAGVYLGRLGSIEIPLPPLEEQRRIAAILDKASAIRTCNEKAVKKISDTKASLFDEMFVAHGLYDHWEQLALGELCDVQGGLQVTSARSSMPIRVPYLRVANVLRGRLDLNEIKEINCSQSELDRTRLQQRDLLVVEGHGNPGEIGRVAMWIDYPGEMVHQNHLIRVRCSTDSLEPEFLCFYLNSRIGRRHLLKRANTTSGLNTISTSVVKSSPIIVPPVNKQKSFCKIIKAIAQLETSLVASSDLHAQLSRSLMGESFL